MVILRRILPSALLLVLSLGGLAAAPLSQDKEPEVPAVPEAPDGLKVTYLANEGFLVEAGGRKVLVDGLFGRYPFYIDISNEVRTQAQEAQGPFADVDLVLASHFHTDHFEPTVVARHLLANPRAVFFSTPQALSKIEALPDSPELKGRLRAAYPAEGTRAAFPELGLEVLNLHHGRDRKPPVENLGLVFEVGGYKVLHVGDTEITREELAATGLGEDGIDLALVPDWLLTSDSRKGMFESIVRPRHLVAMHLPTGYGPDDLRRIRQASPGVVIFREPLESRVFSNASPAP